MFSGPPEKQKKDKPKNKKYGQWVTLKSPDEKKKKRVFVEHK